MQAHALAEKLVEAASWPGDGGGGSGGGGGGGGRGGGRSRRGSDQLKAGTKDHLATLDELQQDLAASWRGFEEEVQRGVQAAHNQMAERGAALLARSADAFHRRQAQTDAQKRFFAAKLQQMKRGGGAPTTSLEVSSVALDWGDPPSTICWEYDADVRAATAGLPPWVVSAPMPPAAGGAVQEQLLSENASLREQLAAGRQREADLLAKMQEAEAAVRRLTKVEEAKRTMEKRLRTVERERQEKNEEVSRLHLQLRGAVDGLKKKTEEYRRQTKELVATKEALAATASPVQSAPPLPAPPLSAPPLPLPVALTHVEYPPYPPTHIPIPPPPAHPPAAQQQQQQQPPPPPNPPPPRAMPQTMVWQPKRAAGAPTRMRRDSLTELQKLKEERELEQAVSGMDDDRPGLGAIPTAHAASSTAQVTKVMGGGGGGMRQLAITPLSVPASPDVPPSARVESPLSPPAASPDTPFGPRVCPSFRNAALLPFSVLAPDEDPTLDFDLENIADKGSRSSAFQAATQVKKSTNVGGRPRVCVEWEDREAGCARVSYSLGGPASAVRRLIARFGR